MMRLTEKQKEKIEEKITKTHCTLCGSRLEYMSETVRLLPYENSYNEFLVVQCPNCGNIEFHNLDILLETKKKDNS